MGDAGQAPAGKDKADARNATRQVLLAAVGGLVLLTGAGFTARTFFLTRRGQLTDRYTKAITQLASDKLTERLGGIYALEHLMAESTRDHDTVVEVLAAFIREQTRDLRPPPATLDGSPPVDPRPATDVQAALSVLARRPLRAEASPIDLSGARLPRANLIGMRLRGASLNGTVLRRADLKRVDLRDAYVHEADLQGASLKEAQMQGAQLVATDLRAAGLSGARLERASILGSILYGAGLRDAHLNDADLSHTSLTGADLNRALV